MPVRVYTIELEQPVLATALVGDPNSTVTYDYIPGSTLRGMFAQRFRDVVPQATQARFQHLFLSGAVRFLHAYPEIAGERSLPTPHSLRAQRGATTAVNVAYQQPTSDLRSVKKSFCLLTSAGLALNEPERELNIHVQRDPQKGRAWRQRQGNQDIAHGTVFRYEALAAGQRFIAAMLFDDPADAADLDTLLAPPTAWLGRSRSAGYGRVRIAAAQPPAPWMEAPAVQPNGAAFTLTLLSDALIRDRRGRPVTGADPDSLSAALGFDVEVLFERSSVAATLVGGFNRTWRMPVPQSPALAAGSVFSLRTRSGAAPPASRINDLLNAGIGERRAEGFGRIAIEWLAQPSIALIDAATASAAKTADSAEPQAEPEHLTAVALPPLDAAAEALAVTMADRLFERLIDERIVAFVQELVLPHVGASSMPGNSQLARLRTIVRRVQLAPNPQAVAAEFARFRPTAMREYERARLRGQSLRTWIEQLLANPESVWLELFEPEARLIHAEQEPASSYADWCATLIANPNELWATVCHPVARAVAGRKPAYSPKRAPDVALRLLAALLEAPAQVRKNTEEGGNE